MSATKLPDTVETYAAVLLMRERDPLHDKRWSCPEARFQGEMEDAYLGLLGHKSRTTSWERGFLEWWAGFWQWYIKMNPGVFEPNHEKLWTASNAVESKMTWEIE